MAANDHHTLLWAGGVAAAGFVAYEFFYKPFAVSQAAAGGASLPLFPSASSMVASPAAVGTLPGGQQGSIVDPRTSPGGDVGQVMWRKMWTQAQATTRLNAIRSGYAAATQALAQLQSASNVNPNAVNIPAAQVVYNQNLQAAQDNDQAAAAAVARGDTAAAATYAATAAAHRSDAVAIAANIAAAQKPMVDTAGIAAYQGQLASLKAEYSALTGGLYSLA